MFLVVIFELARCQPSRAASPLLVSHSEIDCPRAGACHTSTQLHKIREENNFRLRLLLKGLPLRTSTERHEIEALWTTLSDLNSTHSIRPWLTFAQIRVGYFERGKCCRESFNRYIVSSLIFEAEFF